MIPKITLNCALSLDGRLSIRGRRLYLSSKKDFQRVYKLRSRFDALMVGVNTVKIDNPSLTSHDFGKDPIKIIVDSHLHTPATAKCLQRGTVVFLTTKSGMKNSEKFDCRRCCAKLVFIPAGKKRVDLPAALEKLSYLGIRSILLEGGGSLIHSMLEKNLVSKIVITLSPLILGGKGREIISLADGALFKKPIPLRLEKIQKIKNHAVLFYSVQH